jgi:ubiquinol-cytochrome c reductase iron-sulfur subunit
MADQSIQRAADGASGSASDPASDPGSERRNERLVLLLFGITALTGIALLVLYALGGQTQLEGVLLFLALGGVGAGIVIWAQRLMPTPIRIESREPVGAGPEQVAELQAAITEEAGFTRRTLLVRALAGAVAALGAALAIPVFSLGPAPGRSLFVTAWRPGRRLAPQGGEPIRGEDVAIGGIVTVFPDGDPSDPNAATLLIRTSETDFLALSKICTHAGCPVGLYRSDQHVLICPCHQSEFDVLDGARPINGPAVRPLPALPFRQEADGTFTALDDFPEPVGPSFWDMHL